MKVHRLQFGRNEALHGYNPPYSEMPELSRSIETVSILRVQRGSRRRASSLMNFCMFPCSADYIFIHLTVEPTFSGRLSLLPRGIVVERSPVRGFAAEDPFRATRRLAPYAIPRIFSAFATVTLGPVSSPRCGSLGFRDCQQLSRLSPGLSPDASCSLPSMEGLDSTFR